MSRFGLEDSVFEHGGENGAAIFHDEDKRQKDDIRAVKDIAKTETLFLTISKRLVIFSIFLAAGLVSAGTYIFLKNEEDDDYESTYKYVANTAQDAVDFYVRNIFLSARSLSRTLTAQAKALRMEFPLVTFPAFETLCDTARTHGGFLAIFFMPIINDEVDLRAYNNYSVDNQGWITSSREVALSSRTVVNLNPKDYIDEPIHEGVYFGISALDIDNFYAPAYGQPPYMPIWMQSPPPYSPSIINLDMYVPARITMGTSIAARDAIISEVHDVSLLARSAFNFEDYKAFHRAYHLTPEADHGVEDHPHSTMFLPIFQELGDKQSQIVGMLGFLISWDRYLFNLLPVGINGITCVLKNTCGQAYSYALRGNVPYFLGEGDLHDRSRDGSEIVLPLHDFANNETFSLGGHCVYSLHLYTTKDFDDEYNSNISAILTVVVSCTFAFMIIAFFFYDWFVKKRNIKVLDIAAKTTALVSNLFPSNVRDRLLAHGEEKNRPVDNDANTTNKTRMFGKMSKLNKPFDPEAAGAGQRTRLKNFLQSEVERDSNDTDTASDLNAYGSKPIADIFPDTTIFFGDIVGFTAWSSTREPSQVFTLLETIYRAFDDIAARRRVFKVETVGDCYVAVCGLPDPRADHAVVMARFARACLTKMQELVHKLEIVLGPDTADLDLRIGMHSGPVTAGVLRGERARFQLFGDTMNTASRMESTGERGKIQISQETADLLREGGKGSWFRAREKKVLAKGKGELQTYWLMVEGEQIHHSSSVGSGASNDRATAAANQHMLDHRLERNERLVKWNCDLLVKLLKEIEAARQLTDVRRSTSDEKSIKVGLEVEGHGTVLDEVREIIHLPHLTSHQTRNANQVQLMPQVEEQLNSYVMSIAMLYHDNPFHCFEHASHVTMSVSKLMSRIIAPDLSDEETKGGNIVSTLHDHTYGITSDPLTQFACVFSALIHDVDHSGVPNTQLARENPRLAELYGRRSIAEQNSVDLAWNLLMGQEFAELRSAICCTSSERSRFRQLVVNSVMATDIMDKDLKKLRNERWDNAFSPHRHNVEESQKDAIDRKATIVIEHLIQASDVAHTMQHWHIYRKWNQKLYTELYKAFVNGRADRDPADFWYQGELGFFDFYIIPLAKKLKDCGVFGVSSDEYLNYALKNRAEWEARGKEVVADMINDMNSLFPQNAVKETTADAPDIPQKLVDSSRNPPSPPVPAPVKEQLAI